MATGMNQESPSQLYWVTVDDELFTLQDIMARLNLPYSKVRWLIASGKLRAVYLGGRRLRVTARQLDAYLQARDEPRYTVPEVGQRLRLSD
jgi:excisionase family DNA binding protein